jgi:hypothetical protein
MENLMRKTLLLVLLGIVATSFVGCSDEDGTAWAGRRRGGGSGSGSKNGGGQGSGTDTDGNDPSGGPTGTPGGPTGGGGGLSLKVATAAPEADLGDKAEIDVTVEPASGFSGDVDVSVAGLPAGATAEPLKVNVAGAPATAKLVVKADLTATPTAAAGAPLTITAKSGAVQATSQATFKINPKVKLTIPVNADALRAAGVQYRDEWGAAFGAQPQALKTQQGNPIVVTVFNADSQPHIIHGEDGFEHGDTENPIPPNSLENRTRKLNPGINARGYLHDGQGGEGVSFRIQVEVAQ